MSGTDMFKKTEAQEVFKGDLSLSYPFVPPMTEKDIQGISTLH